METSSFRPESHVAQRNRRDKLRLFQQGSASPSVHHLDDFHGNLEQLSVHQVGLNSDLLQASNVRNGIELSDSLYSSGMVDFDALSAQRDVVVDPHGLGALQPNRQMTAEDSSFGSMSSPVLSNFSASTKTCSGDPPQGCNSWTNLDSQPNYDWMVNYASGSVGGESNQRTTFIGEVVLSNNARLSNISASAQHLKPVGYQIHQSVDLQSPLVSASGEITTGQDRQKQVREMNFASRGLYQSSLQQQVTVASYGGNERVLLPSYGNQSVHFDDVNVWVNRPVQDCHQWSGECSLARKSDQELKNIGGDAHTQGLSLSLSSNPPSKLNATQCGGLREADEDSKVAKSNHPSPAGMPSIISNKACGRSLHDLVGTSTYVLRNTGPLGPFTGYATILKSSRFLKPAQELLDEYCKGTSLKLMRVSEASERVSGEASASASADAVNAGADTETGAKGNNNSGVSSSTLYSSNEGSGDGGVGSSSCESYRLEYQQKKAKLLYLQEEVCRKYKQYHQQMQMVASAFETVAGLSASTPYISLAFKMVSRNFRCLRHAISDQLKDVTIRALGEDLPSPNTVASSSKGDTITSRLAYMDQSFQKQKSSGSNIGFLDPPQPVWRPQRGLPERSVAILRAWLFDHFLHPYPTDTDKNMLAAQTGLSRNQVSNWFINARVRVWKPMVEEIHMLETKGSAETNQSGTKNDGNSNSAVDNSTVPLDAEPQPSKPATSSVHSRQLQCCGSGTGSSMGSAEQLNAGRWNQQKRSRFDEFQVPSSVDGSLMSYLPCQRSGIDIGGLGAVSLTLGLRHSVENAQQQHQQQMQQHHEDQLRRQFGGQMIHDFVG